MYDSSKKQLTASGQLLYEEGKALVQQFEQLTQKMQQLQINSKQSIRVGLPTLFAMEFMPLFSNFMFSHPNIEITMVQGGSYELQQKLAKNEIDLGILSFPNYETSITLEPFQIRNWAMISVLLFQKIIPLQHNHLLLLKS